ncbi:uncharacterized protein EI90DRAFT_3077887 [Cantharellus anzutake]|uniref:uncharacterized protein n=1 Tax=Cantharellus anzutake TaxID=1750568 RepID=UPI00190750BC|nr:uncharacterized protein EI90DRAFT_3077887 [Cantharellus anzutake]KAF8322399.1 hypothetical protein EI90DRAFT_3077887 [Cantharellus anzutake]
MASQINQSLQQQDFSAVALLDKGAEKMKAFRSLLETSHLGIFKVHLSQMVPLPGNRMIQQNFVNDHVQAWGDAIDRVNHPMSGLLLYAERVAPDAEGFLPTQFKVQVCHGQHRKLVMEEMIRQTLVSQYKGQHNAKLSASHKFPIDELYAHRDAYWWMNVYSQSLQTESNGMFLTWVLADNVQHNKAPNLWGDLISAFLSFVSESNPKPAPLDYQVWWQTISGNNKAISDLKGIFRSSEMVKALYVLRHIPAFVQDERKTLEECAKGMQNFFASAIEISMWQLAIICQKNVDQPLPPHEVADWQFINKENLPTTRGCAGVSFKAIKDALQNSLSNKNTAGLKVTSWEWKEFKRAQNAPKNFPGNLLQPKGAGPWIFQPDMFYHPDHIMTRGSPLHLKLEEIRFCFECFVGFIWGKNAMRSISPRGGVYNEVFYRAYFTPGPEAFYDTLIPHLVGNETWDSNDPTLPAQRKISGHWIVKHFIADHENYQKITQHDGDTIGGRDRLDRQSLERMAKLSEPWYHILASFCPFNAEGAYLFPQSNCLFPAESPSGLMRDEVIKRLPPPLKGSLPPAPPSPPSPPGWGPNEPYPSPPTIPPKPGPSGSGLSSVSHSGTSRPSIVGPPGAQPLTAGSPEVDPSAGPSRSSKPPRIGGTSHSKVNAPSYPHGSSSPALHEKAVHKKVAMRNKAPELDIGGGQMRGGMPGTSARQNLPASKESTSQYIKMEEIQKAVVELFMGENVERKFGMNLKQRDNLVSNLKHIFSNREMAESMLARPDACVSLAGELYQVGLHSTTRPTPRRHWIVESDSDQSGEGQDMAP